MRQKEHIMSRFSDKANKVVDSHLHVPQGDDYVRVTVTRKPIRWANVPVVPLLVMAALLLLLFLWVCPAIFAVIPHAPAGLLFVGI
jgi:hypothetical protein